MVTYAILPFSIMFLCSMIIIIKLNFSKTNTNRSLNDVEKLSRNAQNSLRKSHKLSCVGLNYSISKQFQITSILLTTNFLFISLVSPLLFMNLLSMLHENTIKTTIVYFLAYSSHGYKS